MLSAINDLMLDMLAAIARKDYVDRRRRQKEGIVKAKSEGRYPGRPSDTELQQKIEGMLTDKKKVEITKSCSLANCCNKPLARSAFCSFVDALK
jgi:DNA invertase Pin-like site-specific DNA recombinase